MLRATRNAHKLTYLTEKYPDKSITDIAGIFEMPPIDFNVAAWTAQDIGLLSIDDKSGKIERGKEAIDYDLFTGEDDIASLLETIPYVFAKLAETEDDMEEETFGNWSQGYRAQDLIISMRLLMDRGVMATYDVVNVHDDNGGKEVSTYTFYTLAGNEEHEWGRKQFSDKKKLKKKKRKK